MRLLPLLLLPVSLMAIDLEPWLTPSFEIQAEGKWLYQGFENVVGNGHDLKYDANDNFAIAHVGVSAFDLYDAQIEVVGAQTKAHSFNFDHASLTLRYQLWNDILGDPLSVVAGVTGIQAVTQAVNDISSFHHSTAEGELHVSLGKEVPCWDAWSSRWWLVAALGSGDTGSAWWRTNAYFDYHMPASNFFIRLFAEGLVGMGAKQIKTLDHFRGYGPIQHRSLDVGVRYSYRFAYNGSVQLQYARRLVAKNFPKQVDLVTLSYLYPFGV